LVCAEERAGRNGFDLHVHNHGVHVAEAERRTRASLIAPRATERRERVEGRLEIAGVNRLRYAALGAIDHVSPQIGYDFLAARTVADVLPEISSVHT
jgi:hypothetical protein